MPTPNWSERVSAAIGVMFSVLGIAAAVLALWGAPIDRIKSPAPATQDSIAALNERVSSLDSRMKDFRGKIDALSQLSDESKASAQLASVQSSLDTLQGRFTKIEGLIVQDPSKSLEIPLLRKDVESVQESTN